jgi:DNA-binding MarR family transcriptional regulator
MSAYKLARILGREHHSVVEIVNRLRRKGLIARTTVDGKPSLEVTDAGEQALGEVLSKRVLLPMLRAVGTENLKQLEASLLPLRAQAMHELGLMDMGDLSFASVDEVSQDSGGGTL